VCRGANRPKPGEFVADELSVMLRDQPYRVRCLLARSRRLAAGLPTVWEGFRRGDLDAEQVRVIDRVARRVTEAATLAAIDDQVIDAAQTRTPKQLTTWLLRAGGAVGAGGVCGAASPRARRAPGQCGARRGWHGLCDR
jgi:hypothetical protein